MLAERSDMDVKEDHEALNAQLEAMEAALESEPDSEKRRKALVCLVVRTLAPDLEMHLRKEEQVLFPALQKLLGGKSGTVDLLKEQHVKIRSTIQWLAGLLCDCGCEEKSKEVDWKEIAAVGKGFVNLLKGHEKKEDQLLADVLRASLKPQELMQLAQKLHRFTWEAFKEEL